MKIDINLSDRALRKRISELKRDMPNAIDTALAETAFEGTNLIIDRSQKGKGLRGSFKPYNPKYAEFRRKKGRGSVVNLDFTGQMWSSLVALKRKGYAEIRFSDALANKKAYFNNMARPFFGFKYSEKVHLLEYMKKRLFK